MPFYTDVFYRFWAFPRRLPQLLKQNASQPSIKNPLAAEDAARLSGVASTSYRPEIDGLRAVAVTGVVLYHAGIGHVTGGFVGVDVFFVISGYLIMATLAADIRQGRFSVLAFYERRIRRIFPALIGMAVACIAAAGVVLPPEDFLQFGQSLAAMAVFASNLFFCFDAQPTGYFAMASATQLLLHSWSLAVEEQFYILLPLGLFALRRASEQAMRRWLLGLAILSFGLSVVAVAIWPRGAFYLVLPRAWELLLGSLLSLGFMPPLSRRLPRELTGLAGLALILAAIFGFTSATPFPGAAALVPCVGAALVIHAAAGGPTLAGRLLSQPPLVWIGLISYSLYLWHWPIIVLVKYLSDGPLFRELRIIILLTSLTAGALSYRFIERPFRGKNAWLSRRGALGAAAAASLAMLLIALTANLTAGLPQRFDRRAQTLIAANRVQEREPAGDNCDNAQKTPGEMRAMKDDDLFCRAGPAMRHNILFFGDSHALSLWPVATQLQREGALGGRGTVFAIATGCVPTLSLNRSAAGYYCNSFARRALERAQAADIDAVLIAFSPWWTEADGLLCLADEAHPCVQRLSRSEAEDRFIADLRDYVSMLRRQGKRVVLQLPEPIYEQSVPRREIDDAILGRFYAALESAGYRRRLRRNDFTGLRGRIVGLAADTGAVLYDPRASLCEGETCRYQRDGVSLYMDNNHIAVAEIGIFHDQLRSALQRDR